MTAVSDQEDFRQRRSLSPVPGRRASALPHLHVSVLLLSAQWAGLHPRLWASCRETVQPQLREQSTVSVAGKRSGRSPTHPFTHSSRNSPDFTRSLFFSPSSPHRADPPLHHRAPAGQTCAALHQPSERRLQDLHQVLLPTLFLLCVLFRLSFCNRSSSALVSAPVSSS